VDNASVIRQRLILLKNFSSVFYEQQKGEFLHHINISVPSEHDLSKEKLSYNFVKTGLHHTLIFNTGTHYFATGSNFLS
jgi:hypothetical protein